MECPRGIGGSGLFLESGEGPIWGARVGSLNICELLSVLDVLVLGSKPESVRVRLGRGVSGR